MVIHDISVAYEDGMLKYPSLLPYERKWLRSFDNGDENQVSFIQTPSHNGTHVDAPNHYIKGGKNLDEMSLDIYYGDCQVINIPEEYTSINLEYIKTKNINSKRILFKTSNSTKRMHEFCDDYVYIEEAVAKYLVEKGVILVGIDYVSVDAKVAPTKPTHMTLLGNDVTILECVDLSKVEEKNYILSALPIKVTGAEGSPCRAILIEE